MNKILITLALLLSDAVGTAFAWWLSYALRYESGIFSNSTPASLFWPGVVLTAFWWLIFGLRRMYDVPVALSRFSEIERVMKAVIIGIVILFIATIDVPDPISPTRLFIVYYGILVIVFSSVGRIVIRTYQRRLRWLKRTLWRAIIVGCNDVGKELRIQLDNFPVWGFRVVGFVDDNIPPGEDLPILGGLNDLPELIKREGIEWILVAPEKDAEKVVTQVLQRCNDLGLRFMLVADQYQMVIGLVRTVEIHGLPLIEVHPQLVSPVVKITKRLIDILAGLVMSFVVLGLTPIIALMIKIESRGPVFYSQKRIGRRGREFTLLKFRSMVQDAEKITGAVWAVKDDPRVTKVGRFLRKSHLDEMPQFFNVLLGQMSLVGPRPERRHFVEEFKTKVPLYERRLRVRPGITGWAQVRHKYDESIADVTEKTRYDLFYIDHLSLLLDIKILLATALKMLRGGGHS